ncbi:MAG: hypothetical protein AAB958_01935, partial [Patescibacteria group bacterium]
PLWFSLTLFFLSIISFIGLKVYLSQLEADITLINNQIKAEAAKISVDDENTVIRLNNSLDAFSKLIASHSNFYNFFSLIESLTYSRVVFTKVDADKNKGLFQLKGTAQNYTALAKQIIALRSSEDIKSLEVRGINFGTNGLDFDIITGVDSKIFVKNNQ